MPTDNPWKLTEADRAMAREALSDVAGKIRERGIDPDPVWRAMDGVILACQAAGQHEVGMIFATSKAILTVEGDHGRDRLLLILINLAADYADKPPGPPRFSRN
jgi:hypothetical protein